MTEPGSPGASDESDRHLALLVEDNPADVAIVEALLSDHPSWHVTSVPTLGAAQRLLRTTPVEVLLLDLGLPDAQGLQTLQRTLAVQGLPPVVVLTGDAAEGAGQAAIDLGAEDYLHKSALTGVDAALTLDRTLRHATTRHRQRRMLERESAELRFVTAQQERLMAHLVEDLQVPVGALVGLVATLAERHRVMRAAERTELIGKVAHSTRELASRLASVIADAQPAGERHQLRRQVRMADIVPAAINSVGQRPDGTRLSLDGDLPTVWGRPDALQHAITEMVRNAIVHAPTGSSPQIAVHVGAYGSGVRITVEDDGTPIPPAMRGAVFEPGVTLDGHSSRDGVGLSQVRAVAAEHGGAVWIDQGERGGNAITLAIPQRGRDRADDGADAAAG